MCCAGELHWTAAEIVTDNQEAADSLWIADHEAADRWDMMDL
jgi:hypothetical protein